jgi:hypothetical protein
VVPEPLTAAIVNSAERKREPAIKIYDAPNPPVAPFK